MNTLDSVFKVMVVHDNPVTGLQAAGVLRRLAERLEIEFAIDGSLWGTAGNTWRFEVLQNPAEMQQAVTRAVEADMIIISAGTSSELPEHVRVWLESALACKHGEPSALVALLDHNHATTTATSRSGDYLRELAERNGVDFFCNTDNIHEHAGSGIDTILSRYEDDSALMPESISYSCNNYRGWGIND